MEPTTVTPQQAAIQDVRARYERGELPLDAFRRALDALVLARDEDECQAILAVLPPAPLAALAALEAAPPVPIAPPAAPARKRIVAFMGQTRKLRRAWQLAQHTLAVAILGEVKLDLTLAALPAHATIQVRVIMGSATLYVPRSARVTVRSVALLGEVNALGEKSGGVAASAHEEHLPLAGPAETTLEIRVFALMGDAKVLVIDGPALAMRPWQRLLAGLLGERPVRG